MYKNISNLGKSVSVKRIQDLDKEAIEKYGIPSIVLMENAGRSAAEVILKSLKKKEPRVCIFCGLGNNAGDGFVIARHLINAGVGTKIFLQCKPGKEAFFTKRADPFGIVELIEEIAIMLGRSQHSDRLRHPLSCWCLEGFHRVHQ